jgi:transposase
MNAYSMDLRERVVTACDRGEGTREEVAKRFCVSIAWVYRLLQRRRQTGSIAPKPPGGGQKPAFDDDAIERLRQAVADCPDATPGELRHATGAACSTAAVHRALEKLGLPRKKTTGRQRAKDWPDSGAPTPRAGSRASSWSGPFA